VVYGCEYLRGHEGYLWVFVLIRQTAVVCEVHGSSLEVLLVQEKVYLWLNVFVNLVLYQVCGTSE